MSNETENPAIIRTEYRQSVAFAGIPSAETCKLLRSYGFDFDRRSGLWLKSEMQGKATAEHQVIESLAA